MSQIKHPWPMHDEWSKDCRENYLRFLAEKNVKEFYAYCKYYTDNEYPRLRLGRALAWRHGGRGFREAQGQAGEEGREAMSEILTERQVDGVVCELQECGASAVEAVAAIKARATALAAGPKEGK